MVKVKICGITNKEDAFWASSLGADFIGINLCKHSTRKVSLKTAKEIVNSLPKYTTAVLVFVNEREEDIVKIVNKLNVQYVQLHGDETEEFCSQLKMKIPTIKIIKVIKIVSDFTDENLEKSTIINDYVEKIKNFVSKVDYILFDTYIDNKEGGTGKVFDWNISKLVKETLEKQNFKLQFFVAGGLNSENVSKVIEVLEPFAVDVSSGIERLPRRKDFEQMKNFIRKVKGS